MIIKGYNNNYYWLQTSADFKTIGSFIDDFAHFIINKNLAIISFDSDSFIPTEEEVKRGWTFKNEIAYFNNITLEELKGPICDNFDQWLIFDNPVEISKMDIFVNYSGFSIDDSHNTNTLAASVTNRFWSDIIRMEPVCFLLCGDNFIYGTTLKGQIDEIAKAWC